MCLWNKMPQAVSQSRFCSYFSIKVKVLWKSRTKTMSLTRGIKHHYWCTQLCQVKVQSIVMAKCLTFINFFLLALLNGGLKHIFTSNLPPADFFVAQRISNLACLSWKCDLNFKELVHFYKISSRQLCSLSIPRHSIDTF